MILNIQILRAFAAINVVLFHVIFTSEKYGFPSFLSFFGNWGESGVDIFFVISGFIICHTQIKKKKNFLEFIKQRLIRIIPIYWMLNIFIIFLYLIKPNIFLSMEVTNKLIFSSFLFISQIINDTYPILIVGWSLEYEIFFYLLFAFFLLFRNINFVLLIFLFIFLILFTQEYLLAEFLFGILLAYFYYRVKKMNIIFSIILIIIGFSILVFSINHFYLIQINNSFDRMLLWGIPTTMILFGLIYIKQYKINFLIFLGNASYSIYLIHLPIITLSYKFLKYSNINFHHNSFALITLILSISAGCILYLFVEKKINKYLKEKLKAF